MFKFHLTVIALAAGLGANAFAPAAMAGSACADATTSVSRGFLAPSPKLVGKINQSYGTHFTVPCAPSESMDEPAPLISHSPRHAAKAPA